ncbi:MAG: hypothetical protein GF308_06015 [Candidatus Heimdallarchaeota archaeon]|nr:hypothetical protein [Candidatus Heimdallarchaeota archaeon]
MKQHAQEKNCECEVQNLITPESPQKQIDFDEYNGIIFGFPVYNERLPTVIEEWFLEQKIKLSETNENRSTIFYAFGGRGFDEANQINYYLLNEIGFSLWLAGEFVDPHSFNVGKGWILTENCPNEEDFTLVKEFVEKSSDIFGGNGTLFQMNAPLKEYKPCVPLKFFRCFWNLIPRRVSDSYQLCTSCEDICPTEAFDANEGKADPSKCILCMACVKKCPEQVIQTGNLTIVRLMIQMQYRFTRRSTRKKKSRIYAEFPQP